MYNYLDTHFYAALGVVCFSAACLGAGVGYLLFAV